MRRSNIGDDGFRARRVTAAIAAATLITALVAAMSAQSAPAGQKPASSATAAQTYTVPRLPDGDPDLEGVWNYGTATPLERPAQWAGREVISEQEAAVWEKENAKRRSAANNTAGADWWEPQTFILKNRRTALIVDPPDGRLPALVNPSRGRGGRGGGRARRYDNPEDLGLQDRCIAWPAAAPPYTPTVYNNNVGILQTKDNVVLQSEMIHVARIVRMNGTHGSLPSMYGDSIGHWDGSTLVVDTTNFDGLINYRNTGTHLHLIERFTRTGPDTMEYRFTVDDPQMWTRPWTARLDMTKTTDYMYEFSCHEGNALSVIGTLKGARMEEEEKAKQTEQQEKK